MAIQFGARDELELEGINRVETGAEPWQALSRFSFLSNGRLIPPFGKQQPDPAAYGPGEQPRQPIPMRPALAPIGNSCANAHRLPEDKEPEHMTTGAARSKSGAEPGTKNRDDNEKRRARDERYFGGDTAFNEITRE